MEIYQCKDPMDNNKDCRVGQLTTKLPKSVQSASLLGSYVRDNVIDGNDDNHDDTDDDGGGNVDADSTWY